MNTCGLREEQTAHHANLAAQPGDAMSLAEARAEMRSGQTPQVTPHDDGGPGKRALEATRGRGNSVGCVGGGGGFLSFFLFLGEALGQKRAINLEGETFVTGHFFEGSLHGVELEFS